MFIYKILFICYDLVNVFSMFLYMYVMKLFCKFIDVLYSIVKMIMYVWCIYYKLILGKSMNFY